MAAPVNFVLANVCRNCQRFSSVTLSLSWARSNSSWRGFFKKEKDVEEPTPQVAIRKPRTTDGPSTLSQMQSLKRKTGMITVRGYNPPPNVEQKVTEIAESLTGKPMKLTSALTDRQQTFEILTQLMEEFDHEIPNTELTSMKTLEDIVKFFSVPVQDQSSFDDLTKLDLPRNLHIQMEPVRFNAETDTFFDGQTAFPQRPTVVTSLKYSRKFKGNQGESRNERSMTEFERNKAKEMIK